MSLRERIKRSLSLLLNIPYISKDFYEEGKGPFLLHISDTPEEIHSYLIKLVKKINPQYIVHTGDIVDNIKLEIDKQKKDSYLKGLKKTVKYLETTDAKDVYFTAGNHDDRELIKAVISRSRLLEENETFTIEGYSFYASHYFCEARPSTDYYLFGHSFEPKNKIEESKILLNGLTNINVIDLSTGRVYIAIYPLGTNQFRKMERVRIGI